MRPAFLLPLLVLLIMLLSEPVSATELFVPGGEDSPVELEADQLSFDEPAGRYLARGNVRLVRGDLELRCEELSWQRATGLIEASGDVVMEGPEERLTGRRVSYDINAGTGVIEGGQVEVPAHSLRVSGERIEKRGVADYRIIDGSFTTCEAEVPSWKFAAGKLDLTIDGYARARHAVFYLKDVPAFYLPYLIYPAKTDRESGLLMPSFGHSDRRGTEFSTAYYQVIARNQDATIYLDHLSQLGLGKGLEYRYVFGSDNTGEASAYHVSAREGADRHAFTWEHMGQLPGRVRLSADGEYVSEPDFFTDFGVEAGDYNRTESVSVLALSRNWGLYNLVGQFRYTDDLTVEDPATLQWLPRVSLNAARQRVGTTPFYYAFASDYSRFWREEGERGQRLNVRPAVLGVFKLWDMLDVIPAVGWTERHYWLSEETTGHEQTGIFDFSTRVSSQFYRVYPGYYGSVSAFRHLLEPEVTYRYVADVDQQDLPEFDSVDRTAATRAVEYGLSQRVTTKAVVGDSPAVYRDLLFFRLSQRYDLEAEERRLARFSPLRGQLTLAPAESLQLLLDSRYDLDSQRWQSYSGEVQLNDQRGNRLGLEYRREKATEAADEIDYASLQLNLAWLKPLYLDYRTRYDFVAGQELEQVLDLEYRHQCWSLILTLREREDDRSVMLNLSLGGIGAARRGTGSMGDG